MGDVMGNPFTAVIRDERAADSQMKAALSRNVQHSKDTAACVKPFKLEMKPWKTKFRRRDSRRPLLENNNNNNNNDENQQDGTCCDSVVAQNNSNRNEERHLQSEKQLNGQPLAELLGVAPDADSIQRYVSLHFPKPPVDVDQNLPQHLLNVQETVHKELVKLGPLLKPMGLMECLIESYHRQTFEHLDDLLNKINSSKNCFALMMWLRDTYLSQEPCDQSDLHEMDPIKIVDMLLFTECAAKAKDKLLEHVKKEVRGILEGILQHERSTEAYDELNLDTIQCIDAMHRAARTISQKLSDYVQEVCFLELGMFLESYTTVHCEILEKKAKMDKPETKHFFKTLNNCNKLKQYVQTKAKGTLLKETKDHSIFEETVAMLEDMEDSTLKLLMTIVANTAKSHLKRYFNSDSKEFFLLIEEVKSLFSELSCCQDIGLQKRVIDEAYKLIAHVYLKYLIKSKQSKLRKCWSPNVGQTVAKDAKILHDTFSVLAPGVRQWNLMLLKVKDLLECESSDTTKLMVGSMQIDCCTWSEDLELLPKLLQWKGLSQQEVKEVLKVLEDLPR
ncbi:tumor necrosis factor alpha-induced protein 2 isoform X3 [Sander lucioperca]|uniref:tumor necrosis factor alpha-induced protein 2 isoform X3 n=1 Tax=Sander lucioperca TaxID=283035 RepID=UPI00125D4430|nr:tumor necrosis factor alpha-induced protein 2 isoform X3 [Sander lucioperca]